MKEFNGNVLRTEYLKVSLKDIIYKIAPHASIDVTETQRPITEWDSKKENGYIIKTISGVTPPNLRLCDISKSIINLKSLSNVIEESELESPLVAISELKHAIDYLQEFKNKDSKFLILDGSHRITYLKKFIDGNIILPTNTFITISLTERVNIGDKPFEDFPHKVKEYILNSVSFTIDLITRATLLELKEIFLSHQGSEPASDQQKRLLSDTWIANYVRFKSEEISNKTKLFWGDCLDAKKRDRWALNKGGDQLLLNTLIALEFLPKDRMDAETTFDMMYNNSTLNGDKKSTVKSFIDKVCSKHYNILFKLTNYITDNKNNKIRPRKHNIKELFNMLLFIDLIVSEQWNKLESNVGTCSISIKDYRKMAEYYEDSEELRMTHEAFIVDSNGTQVLSRLNLPMVNPDSYRGLSNKTIPDAIREKKIMIRKDIQKDLYKLKSKGIIILKDSKKTASKSQKDYLKGEFKNDPANSLGFGELLPLMDDLEIHHQEPHSLGGPTEIENLKAITKDQNRSYSDTFVRVCV